MAKWFVEIFFFYSFFVVSSRAADTLYSNQSIKVGETIVSADGVFELGFFSPGGSKNRYLCIRYKKASSIIAWLANRYTPITDASGTLNLSSQGTLQIFDGSNTEIWSTNSSKSLKNPVAQLLNTGNLVIRSDDEPDSRFYLWQSFDYPDNTLVPGMKIGKNLEAGLVWSFNSWKSSDDPSPGIFQVRIDITGYPQLVLYNGSSIQIRIGPWNGARFSGIPSSGPTNIFRDEFAITAKEIYYKYELDDNSVLIRTTVEPDGRVIRYTSTGQTNTWQATIFLQPDYCDYYARCGANGICSVNTLCRCLDGFQPKNDHAWNSSNFSEGCVQESQWNCSSKDKFVPRLNMKWPDTRNSSYDLSMKLEDCEKKCLRNCSCKAYAYVNNTENGRGCLFWFGGLIDIRDQEQSGLGFYVRVPSSGSGSGSSSRARQIALFVLVPIVSFLTVILAFYLRNVCKYRKKCREGDMVEIEIDKGKEDLPLFDFRTIANATNNFSDGNKLGQGGFGPVYKGILEDGQEVAVKRRSTGSTQGVEEFGNEVSCIAKLQHRNLVRLLGWSTTEEGERLLVYEYMPNKSLDYFIFGADIKQRASLDWPKRYKIINGIAKGLLYLHEDSRLRVIHRDLKASNILLDYNMNPKISDFGMARSFGDGEIEANTARVVGTYGYMAPEYAVEGVFSVKSDVYSFGVLVIEILSGKKSRFFNHPGHNLNLIGHAWTSYNEDRLSELIDVSILKTSDRCETFRTIQIGLLCVQQYPEDRPNMSSVLMMLTSKGSLPHPKQPGFFIERKFDKEYSSSRKHEENSSNSMLDSSSSNQTITIVSPR
ncbi:Receptor-like serine/threonine-protein kinase [Heracleum sosnowskyi]|uniref:Receptor-like serine/threonine-protein kinase n=1 Tax=Heracleum sosnowskyi TaxID=360622 RepID=A0AAD8ISU7_9APIA|nr:Receptor-like serine/threonine-protein kinase [Heracleum sosnowskyi]